MPVYTVITKFMEEKTNIVRADDEKEAERIAHDLAPDAVGGDYYWYDSEVHYQEEDEDCEIECDNDD